MEIGEWAEENGLARETISRGFASAYGVTPTVFRAEWRARAAWLRVVEGPDALCTIAAETGFADQAHMTRWIHRVSGTSPAAWRRDVSSFNAGATQTRTLKLQLGSRLSSIRRMSN